MFLRLFYSKTASLKLQLKLNILKKQKTLQNAYSLLSDVNFFVRLRDFSLPLAKLLSKSCFPILCHVHLPESLRMFAVLICEGRRGLLFRVILLHFSTSNCD